jgi:DNA-directed RNA polymerase
VSIGMDWLITCASLLAHEGQGISWTAPSGFPVVQRYISAPSVRVETYSAANACGCLVPGTSKKVNKEKQKSAISPNHTHSLDAAHLILTVLKAEEYGVTDFALIHDSFGTLAADTDAMFSAVRDAFVEMYTAHDPFQHLYEQVYESLSEAGREKLPRPPTKGNLDLSQVQQSLYAFA